MAVSLTALAATFYLLSQYMPNTTSVCEGCCEVLGSQNVPSALTGDCQSGCEHLEALAIMMYGVQVPCWLDVVTLTCMSTRCLLKLAVYCLLCAIEKHQQLRFRFAGHTFMAGTVHGLSL